MPLRLSEDGREALDTTGLVSAFQGSGNELTVQLRTGARPSAVDDAAAGTIIATLTAGTNSYSLTESDDGDSTTYALAASLGPAAAASTYDYSDGGDGIGHARILRGSDFFGDMTVGGPGTTGTPDIAFASDVLVSGASITISQLDLVFPETDPSETDVRLSMIGRVAMAEGGFRALFTSTPYSIQVRNAARASDVDDSPAGSEVATLTGPLPSFRFDQDSRNRRTLYADDATSTVAALATMDMTSVANHVRLLRGTDLILDTTLGGPTLEQGEDLGISRNTVAVGEPITIVPFGLRFDYGEV